MFLIIIYIDNNWYCVIIIQSAFGKIHLLVQSEEGKPCPATTFNVDYLSTIIK